MIFKNKIYFIILINSVSIFASFAESATSKYKRIDLEFEDVVKERTSAYDHLPDYGDLGVSFIKTEKDVNIQIRGLRKSSILFSNKYFKEFKNLRELKIGSVVLERRNGHIYRLNFGLKNNLWKNNFEYTLNVNREKCYLIFSEKIKDSIASSTSTVTYKGVINEKLNIIEMEEVSKEVIKK